MRNEDCPPEGGRNENQEDVAPGLAPGNDSPSTEGEKQELPPDIHLEPRAPAPDDLAELREARNYAQASAAVQIGPPGETAFMMALERAFLAGRTGRMPCAKCVELRLDNQHLKEIVRTMLLNDLRVFELLLRMQNPPISHESLQALQRASHELLNRLEA